MVSVEWMEGKVRFIDQTLLPSEERFISTDDYHVVHEGIKSLRIRGAPAIGVAAAFSTCLALHDRRHGSLAEMQTGFRDALTLLSGSRPTAVNLFAALDRMRWAVERSLPLGMSVVRERALAEAFAIQQEDIAACREIGALGATLFQEGSRVLTHCNTGALATAGSGTALSVIVTAAGLGRIARVFVGETRPLFQGARLTAWELRRAGIDHVLITDSTAGMLLGRGEVDAVIVGADRIAANGDTANKIGTYPLAVLARHHHVPFYIAAPTSTIDRETPRGDAIPIEERDPREVTDVNGRRIAPEGVRVFAPAFDVTPHGLITAIITELGILRSPLGRAIGGLPRQASAGHAEGR